MVEMPDFHAAYEKYPDVQFLMVNATDGVQETVEKAKAYIAEAGYTVHNLDCTIIAQKPKISPYIDDIRTSVADVLDIPRERVNVKATTEEKMGFTGSGDGIAAHAVCIIKKRSAQA